MWQLIYTILSTFKKKKEPSFLSVTEKEWSYNKFTGDFIKCCCFFEMQNDRYDFPKMFQGKV